MSWPSFRPSEEGRVSELERYLEKRRKGDVLPLKDELDAAERFTMTVRDIELSALGSGIMPARYDRNRSMLSLGDQALLLRSTVAVIGCGGLGGYVIEELARLGVGCLKVVDDDAFQDHNLNRQVLCTTASIGMTKVEVAKNRVLAINPAVEVISARERFTRANGGGLVSGANVVVDALDSVSSRRDLAAVCEEVSVPLVHGSIGGWYGQIVTEMPGDRTVERIYSASGDGGGIEKVLGNPSFTPAVVASLQVAEVCKLLIGRGTTMARRMWFINLLDMEIDGVEI